MNCLGVLATAALGMSLALPAQAEDSVLLNRSTDNKWFTYVLGSAGVVEKGFMPFTRSSAYSVVSREDFDGDGQSDLLLRDLSAGRDENGRWVMYTLNGTVVTSRGFVDGLTRSSDWELKATADFNGDLRADLLLRNKIDGRWLMYAMDGHTIVAQGIVAMSQQLSDQFQGVADFNGDGRSEVLLRRNDGTWILYALNGLSVDSTSSPAFSANPLFTLQALADFNADGKDDVLLRRNDGRWFMYLMNGAALLQQGSPALTEATSFGLEAVADFNGDGTSDILVRRNTDGRWFLYLMSGISVNSSAAPDMTKNLLFNIVKTADFTGDGKADLLMRRADGRWVLYAMNGTAVSLKVIPDMTRNLAWRVKEFPPAILFAPGSDAHLYALSLSAGDLQPTFTPLGLAYSVDTSATSTTVTPKLMDFNASVTVNGVPVVSGKPSQVIGLDTGANPISVIVTGEDGITSLTYEVTVNSSVPTTVTLSGKITFDLVPRNPLTNGLDYPNTVITPAAGIRVQAIAVSDGTTVLASADTDNNGDYTMTVPSQTQMFLRARAQMVKTGAPNWDFTVVDNNGVRDPVNPPVYALAGDNFNSGVANQAVNLHAASGWGGASYTAPRAAAPFSILYGVKQAVDLVIQADATASFPSLALNWSPNNSVAAIGTSFYNGKDIYLLGKEDEDTEEFDHAIIVHEWGHYFENEFGRGDNIGGSHQGGDVLDARVAFGEGWGNAFQSMARGSTLYYDTGGVSQGFGFSFDLEANCESSVVWGPRGWFNECSVQALLYDIFDDVEVSETSGDSIDLGFAPIYTVLVGQQMATQSLTTVHSFSKFLRDQNPGAAAGIDGLLNYHNIASGAGITEWGTGETNDGSPRTDGLDASVVILPIYRVGLPQSNVCVDVDPAEGDYNKLGNRQFIRFTVPSNGNYQITATTTSQSTAVTPDPDMVLYNQGATHYAFDLPNAVEVFCGTGASFDFGTCVNGLLPLQAGVDYVLEVQDDNNLSYNLDPAHIGTYCMQIEISQP